MPGSAPLAGPRTRSRLLPPRRALARLCPVLSRWTPARLYGMALLFFAVVALGLLTPRAGLRWGLGGKDGRSGMTFAAVPSPPWLAAAYTVDEVEDGWLRLVYAGYLYQAVASAPLQPSTTAATATPQAQGLWVAQTQIPPPLPARFWVAATLLRSPLTGKSTDSSAQPPAVYEGMMLGLSWASLATAQWQQGGRWPATQPLVVELLPSLEDQVRASLQERLQRTLNPPAAGTPPPATRPAPSAEG
ncbi:MAG: hypothetical protein IMX01_04800 [Limnochordaceae bacterium]|nr:hypothetical protein [Limnochordaceae bacterium]